MDRREFLVRATIGGITVPLLVRELGCDGDGGPGPDPGGSTTFPSQEAQGHSHSITIPDGDLASGSQQIYPSTSVDQHAHTVRLEPADLATLNRGCRVIKPSSVINSHQHIWEIRYASKVSDITRTSVPDGTGHSHDVTVAAGDINAAPSSSVYDTTESNPGAHTHEVTLNQSHFETLQNCGIVTITSSQDPSDEHTHSFSITPA